MSKEAEHLQDAITVGQILLSDTVFPHLEAFSENALYCGRGMLPMNKLKTVKEVCDLTGLTRKHLYYFHHEKVVQAAGYANYSVYGYDGYKLYDDAAVEKLQQIALYYQLGLKRDEIRDIMLDPHYDSNMVIETLLAIEHAKKATIERHIAALEYLKLSGTRNRLLSSLHGISLEELGETLMRLKADQPISTPATKKYETFARELSKLIATLHKLDETQLNSSEGAVLICRIIHLSKKHMGTDGCPFVIGLFASAIGGGIPLQELREGISPAEGKAVMRYFVQHPEVYTASLQDTSPVG